jgi:hypothetical protein
MNVSNNQIVEEKITCPICDSADGLLSDAKDMGGASKTLSLLRNDVFKQHPKCNKCNVFFGGNHSGGEYPVPDTQLGMCFQCARKYVYNRKHKRSQKITEDHRNSQRS